jgi:RHS repeat-associated protein
MSQSGTTKTPLGFQGKYYDQESGLNYFYHRYYNPTLGRFISEDPVGFNGGDEFYTFTRSNPLNAIDPFGLKCTQKTNWKPTNVFSDPSKTGTSMYSIIIDTYILKKETFYLKRKPPFIGYYCEYELLNKLKITNYQKERLFEAVFECESECNKTKETKYKFMWGNYVKKEQIDVLGPVNKKIKQLYPCLPTYSETNSN